MKPNIKFIPFVEKDIETQKLVIEKLKKEPFETTTYQLFGKIVKSPRKMAWYTSEEDKKKEWVYVFSKNHINGLKPKPFTMVLNCFANYLYSLTGVKYNAVLINYYKNGMDKISPHSDDDPWLGEKFEVPSFSFGSERTIIFKDKKTSKTFSYKMPSGSLLIMGKGVQKLFTHEIKPEKGKGERFNLTFRKIIPSLVTKMPKGIKKR